jgi:hypothetical protein
MKKADLKLVLWENVSALMRSHYGKENLTRLAADAKIGPGTASRIKQQETSVGLDTVDAIAKAFKLDPWQLLVPHMNAEHPPHLQTRTEDWPFESFRPAQLTQLPPDRLGKIEGYIESVLESFADATKSGKRIAA